MIDQVHTNEQRVQKINSVFNIIAMLEKTVRFHYGCDHRIMHVFEPLLQEAKEAEGCVKAIERELEQQAHRISLLNKSL